MPRSEENLRKKDASMQNCKPIAAMVFECYLFMTSSCIVIHVDNEMMMSVLQEIRGLTKELYFNILSRRKSSFHAKLQVNCSQGLPVLT